MANGLLYVRVRHLDARVLTRWFPFLPPDSRRRGCHRPSARMRVAKAFSDARAADIGVASEDSPPIARHRRYQFHRISGGPLPSLRRLGKARGRASGCDCALLKTRAAAWSPAAFRTTRVRATSVREVSEII
jgi:hypothetical protein